MTSLRSPSGRRPRAFARKPDGEPARACEDGEQHVVVCGLTGLGLVIAERLSSAGVSCVVVEERPEPSAARQLQRWGVPLVAESSRDEDSLRQACVEQATAVIAAHDADLDNLDTALLAADLVAGVDPPVRLVVRLANPRLGEQLQRALPDAVVLSVPEKAGASFVEGCVQWSMLHAFPFAGTRIEVLDVEVGTPGTLRSAFGDLTPVALRRADGGSLLVCPGRDTPLQAGDHVTLLGRPADFAAAGIGRDEEEADALAALATTSAEEQLPRRQRYRRRHPVRAVRESAQALVGELDKSVRIALCIVFTIIVISTIVLRFTYENTNVVDGNGHPVGFSWLQALYFTTTIVATVGFGDYSFAREPAWLTAFGIFLIFVGAAAVATLYAMVTNFIVNRRLEQAFGRRRAITARGHVVVVGLGAIGLQVVEGLLAIGREVVVIERDLANRFLVRARSLRVPVVFGDATVRTVLRQAGLHHAAAIAAVTSSDLANLETALVARSAHDETSPHRSLRVVLRMFDTALADKVERRFGIHAVRSDAALAAPWFVGAALGYDVVSTFYTEGQPFLVARLAVEPGGGLDGVVLSELGPRVRVVAVLSDAGLVPRPTRHTRLAADEQLLLVGPPDQVIAAFRTNRTARLHR